jgi:hypothetical protein
MNALMIGDKVHSKCYCVINFLFVVVNKVIVIDKTSYLNIFKFICHLVLEINPI